MGAIDNKYAPLEPVHAALLMMLEDFSGICSSAGLTWYAHFGAAIGALREGGFIPWDEDLDIVMPRADLDELTRIVSEEHADKYEMINAQINPRYPMMTYRMMLKGTKLADSALASMDFPSMIFLDLFPMDDLADDEAAFNKQVKKAWTNNKFAIAQKVANPYIKQDGSLRAKVLLAGTKVLHGVLNLPGLKGIDFNARSLAWCTKYNGSATKRLGFPCDTVATDCIFMRADMEPARMVPFENTQVPVAHNVEAQLEIIYGDFMVPVDASMRDEHFPDIIELGPYAERFGAKR